MTHWSYKYIGKEYILNEYDCVDLVEEVLREEFGKDIRLPQHHNLLSIAGASNTLLENVNHPDFYKVGEPVDGDVILMKIYRLWHVGVFYIHNNIEFCIHNQANVGVIVQRINTIRNKEGYFRCKYFIPQTHLHVAI